MTCKDCIHHDVCVIVEISANKDEEDYYTEFGCDDFKNKADFVEVVRCKDCKHRSTNDFRSFYCRKDDVGCKDDDFCSCGERGVE